jgi:hypothetical protein
MVPRVIEGAAVEDLEKMTALLMTAVRNLPPGQQRQDAMKEAGRLRNRVCELLCSGSSQKEVGGLRNRLYQLVRSAESLVENDAAKKRSN